VDNLDEAFKNLDPIKCALRMRKQDSSTELAVSAATERTLTESENSCSGWILVLDGLDVLVQVKEEIWYVCVRTCACVCVPVSILCVLLCLYVPVCA
jgi:hypothetical protein